MLVLEPYNQLTLIELVHVKITYFVELWRDTGCMAKKQTGYLAHRWTSRDITCLSTDNGITDAHASAASTILKRLSGLQKKERKLSYCSSIYH